MFKCIICGFNGKEINTSFFPRDRVDLKIVDCPRCGHRQLFPLLTDEELREEYDNDITIRSKQVKIAPGSDFTSMRKKFKEWTKIHADMYWPILQKCKKVINIGSGYGFLEEELNLRDDKRFDIIGNEIGKYRINHYVGGGDLYNKFCDRQNPR